MSTAAPPDRTYRPPLTVYLAAPRGFCAGVDRAIQIVELALAKYGAPVYVRHEIVHNRFVVDSLKAKGAVFVEELDDIPETDQPVIFSAHGVAKAVPAAARQRNMFVLDATCPLVFKVHNEAARHHEEGLEILLIGHAGHPEVVGTMGQLPKGVVTLIETAANAHAFEPRDAAKLAFVTQTTLSVDDTAAIVCRAARPFSAHRRPAQGRHLLRDNQSPGGRQSHRAENRLPARRRQSAELQLLAPRRGRRACRLLRRPADRRRPRDPLERVGRHRSRRRHGRCLGPEKLVEEVIEAFRERYDVTIETVTTALERTRPPTSTRPSRQDGRSRTWTSWGTSATHVDLGDDDGARRYYAAMVSAARELGAGMVVIYGLERLAFAQLPGGSWTTVRSCADEALALARSVGQPTLTAAPLAWLALLAALTGSDDYEHHLAGAEHVVAQHPLGILTDPVHDLTRWAKGTRAAAAGDAPTALHHLAALRVPALQRLATVDRIEAAVRADAPGQARAWVAELTPLAEATNHAWALADIHLGRALTAEDPADASESFEGALRHFGRPRGPSTWRGPAWPTGSSCAGAAAGSTPAVTCGQRWRRSPTWTPHR